jgi:predicted ferric reductase
MVTILGGVCLYSSYKLIYKLWCLGHGYTHLEKKVPQARIVQLYNSIYGRLGSKSILHYLLCAAFLLLNIIFMGFGTATSNMLLKSTGTFLAPNILFAIVMALKYSPIKLLTRITYERYINFHKFLGDYILCLSVFHTIAYMANWSRPVLQNHPLMLRNMFVPLPRTFGMLALLCIVLIKLFSLDCIRGRNYRIFVISHYLYVLFVVFTALHRGYFFPYLYAILCLVAIDFLICLNDWRRLHRASIQICQDDYVRIFIKYDRCVSPGQHIYIYVPGISRFESHPFSIVNYTDNREIELGIKSGGKFTKKMTDLYRNDPYCYLRFTGPFGGIGANYHRYDELVIICGGIGITPFIGMLNDIFSRFDNVGDQCAQSCIESIVFVWFCKDSQLYKIYKDYIDRFHERNVRNSANRGPVFMPIVSIKVQQIDRSYLKQIDVDTVFTGILGVGAAVPQPELNRSGIADLAQLADRSDHVELGDHVEPADRGDHVELENYINSVDFIDIKIDDDQPIQDRRIGVMCCGSQGLRKNVWSTCFAYNSRRTQIDFHDYTLNF